MIIITIEIEFQKYNFEIQKCNKSNSSFKVVSGILQETFLSYL
jgi:uncharacterized protein YueI